MLLQGRCIQRKENVHPPNYRGMIYKVTKAIFKVGDRDTERGNEISGAQTLGTDSSNTRLVHRELP